MGVIAGDKFRHPVLHDGGAEIVDDESRRVDEAIEQIQHARADVHAGRVTNRRGLAGQMEQVIALVLGQPQRPGQRAQHRRGGMRPALLLEARVVVRRDRSEGGYLVSSQAGGATPPALMQADVGGLQPFAPVA
jgi:hypothetical protein